LEERTTRVGIDKNDEVFTLTNQLKFSNMWVNKNFIFLDLRICPWYHLQEMKKFNNFFFKNKCAFLWCQPGGDSHLTTYYVRMILSETLKFAGIQDLFMAYFYKHTAISFLVRN
jgi:hypothetical protein